MSDTNTGGAPAAAEAVTNTAPESTATETQQNAAAMPGAQPNGFAAKTVANTEQKPDAKQQPTAAAKEAIRKMKLKVDGREEELTEDEVIKLAQLGRASDKRFQDAAKTRKQAEDVLTMLKDRNQLAKALSNPAIGIDPYEWAQDLILQKMQQEQMSPEQRRIQDLETRLREREDADRQRTEQTRAQQQQALQDQYSNEYKTSIPEALKSVGLPQTEYTQKRMAHYMYRAITEGVDLQPKDVAGLVRADYMKELLDMVGQADGDTIIGLFGDQLSNKIRKADLQRLRTGNSAAPSVPKREEPVAGVVADPEAEVVPKNLNIHQWREWQKNRFKK